MLKDKRFFLGFAFLLVLFGLLPFSFSVAFRSAVSGATRAPMSFSASVLRVFRDAVLFKKNADENRALKKSLGAYTIHSARMEELKAENERLSRLLDLRDTFPVNAKFFGYARVIGRSSGAWARNIVIDKGARHKVHLNMPVLSGPAVVGRVTEVWPTVSKVRLLTDPNFRMGVMLPKDREQGVLAGTLSGECRMKYISPDARPEPGDIVETAGLGSFYPKGLLVGKVKRVYSEPGQIYQVADIRPLAKLGALEEVTLLESRGGETGESAS